MTKLIAEIGRNHLGDEEKLFSMIKTLSENKISSCKLQYRGDDDFFDSALEMGSTLISQELENVNLSLATTVSAIEYSKGLGIEVGVSFFRIADAKKLTNIVMPDYFKVPSAEALNFELIQFLQNFDRPVYVSTGGLSYVQLQEVAQQITFRQMDCVMYCVANYPADIGASIPSYIDQYRSMFNCQIGYSSHDMHWEMNIAFLDRNVDIIERHFTADKNDRGLDISTFSDIEDLIKLQAFCNSSIWSQSYDLKQKNANQGELQNIKDLGSGYYFQKNYIAGDEVNLNDLLIKSPCRGIKAGSLKNVLRLSTDALKGDPLSSSHVTGSVSLSAKTKELANDLDLSIPVRLHDFARIS